MCRGTPDARPADWNHELAGSCTKRFVDITDNGAFGAKSLKDKPGFSVILELRTPDGSPDLATLITRANDDFGQAEPARFRGQCLRGHRLGRMMAQGGLPPGLIRDFARRFQAR